MVIKRLANGGGGGQHLKNTFSAQRFANLTMLPVRGKCM